MTAGGVDRGGDGDGPLGVITGLHLPGNSLAGALPEDFGRGLPRLQVLDVSHNNLTGTIPSGLAAARELRDLILHDNLFEGELPDALQGARKLRRLILASNQLQGSVPPWLGQLSQLEVLILSDNALEGTIPAALANLTSLTHLYLHNNRLHGLVPRELAPDEETGPQYLFVNGRNQPTRLSFDSPPPGQEREHVTVRSQGLIDKMVDSDVEDHEVEEGPEAQQRYRKRKLREHKQRMVEKLKRENQGKTGAHSLEYLAGRVGREEL